MRRDGYVSVLLVEQKKVVLGSHLRDGSSTNCGCIRKEKMRLASIKDETGKTYGFLFVNRMAYEEEKPRNDRYGVYWNCTCTNCGKENVLVLYDAILPFKGELGRSTGGRHILAALNAFEYFAPISAIQ